MNILLDECVDRRLANEIVGHTVSTVPSMGWAGKRNGELLTLASSRFDVFLSVDRNLPLQQDLTKYDLAVIVLVTGSNRLVNLRTLVPKLLQAIPTAARGQATIVS